MNELEYLKRYAIENITIDYGYIWLWVKNELGFIERYPYNLFCEYNYLPSYLRKAIDEQNE
jgi:hypothetical protein